MSASYPRAVSRFAAAALESRAAPRQPPAPAPRPLAYETRRPPARRTVVRLWLPATPILWLLSPFPLALAPLIYLVPPAYRPANPFAAVLALGRLLTSVGGT